MLGSFDRCKGSASQQQALQYSLLMQPKIVHETFLQYLVHLVQAQHLMQS